MKLPFPGISPTLDPMQDQADFPRLPKIPFIIFDVLLVLVALAVAYGSDGPLSPALFFLVVFCIALGSTVACLPFYLEFKTHARLAEFDRAGSGAGQLQRLDLIETGLRNVQTAAERQADDSGRVTTLIEGFFKRFEDKLNQPQPLEPGFSGEMREGIEAIREQLRILTDSAHKSPTAALIDKIEARLDRLSKHLAELKSPTPEQEKVPVQSAAAKDIPKKQANPVPPQPEVKRESPAPAKELATKEPPAKEPAAEEVAAEELAGGDRDTPAEDDKVVEKPPTENAADSEPRETGDKSATGPQQPELIDDIPDTRLKTAKPGKQKTTLIAQVLIGIGNKPYLRGEGPGLSPDKGVAMDFLEIGKWQWIAPEGDAPIKCRIYKNDEIAAEGEAILIEPGQRRSVAPRFPQ